MAQKKLFDSAKTASKLAKGDSTILPMKGVNTLGKWLGRIKASQRTIEDKQSEWDRNQRRYLNQSDDSRHSDDDREILVPSLYWHVEEKKAWLLPATPKVVVTAKRPDSVAAAPLVELVMNDVLTAKAPDGVGAMTALEEVMSDMLVGSGIFAVNIGYENVQDGTKQVPHPEFGMQPDPSWQPPDPSTLDPTMPPPQAPMVPVTVEEPNYIDTWFMNRIEPSKLLIPDDFTLSDYDKAAWLGFEFLMDEFLARNKWKTIPEDFEQFADGDDRLMNADSRERQAQDKRNKFRMYCIFYKASVFDQTVKNPYQYRMLILLEGFKKPVEHKDNPFQWRDPDGTLCGMMGNPIHIGALRYVADSAFPPSDATMSQYQDREITDGRNDMRLQRERNIPMRVANMTRLKEAGIEKIERAPYGSIIPLDENAFGENGQMPIKDVQTFAYPQENFTFDTINNRDLDATFGSGASSGGAIPTGAASTSATMSGAAERAAQSRRDREQGKFMDWYAGAINKLFPLYQQFATDTFYVNQLGHPDADTLVAWNKDKIQGKFAFSIQPKASPVEAQQRQDELNWYQLVAKSPNIDLRALDTELVKSFGKDPAKVIKPVMPPPPPPPELPKGVTLALDKMLATPASPDFEIGIAILAASGIHIPPDVIARAQQQTMRAGLPPVATAGAVNGQVVPPPPAPGVPGPPPPPPQHGGAVEQVEPIDKNMIRDNVGGVPGGTR